MSMNALFEAYPGLAGKLPHVGLAELPTPVDGQPGMAEDLGLGSLWVKRDDMTSPRYGGNKVRKLEFLLGQAMADGAGECLTFGCVGSNHALATTIHARRLHMGTTLVLYPQPNSRKVQMNLMGMFAAKANIYDQEEFAHDTGALVERISREREKATGTRPYLIPAGGTNAIGACGFVSAGLELAAQIEQRQLPLPDVIYLALGTMGTGAGLSIGLKAAGLDVPIIGARVTGKSFVNTERLARLTDETLNYLSERETAFASLKGQDMGIEIDHGQFGQEYARYTEASVAAVDYAHKMGSVELEGTYTGKAFATLMQHAREGRLAGKKVLFWNTYNSAPLDELLRCGSKKDMPAVLRHYLDAPVQELDR
jgi:1-aminocyclopropane-1-carboxylate deaminase/D-cysteine desulfhydrase-like pyridoxal-dependent ACC family enzyme